MPVPVSFPHSPWIPGITDIRRYYQTLFFDFKTERSIDYFGKEPNLKKMVNFKKENVGKRARAVLFFNQKVNSGYLGNWPAKHKRPLDLPSLQEVAVSLLFPKQQAPKTW